MKPAHRASDGSLNDVTRLYLVRHGRASAGWDTAIDPQLDELGHRQSLELAAARAAWTDGCGHESAEALPTNRFATL